MIHLIPTVIYSIMLGTIGFALLEIRNKPRHKQTFCLAALFFLLLVHILGELYIVTGAYQYAPALAGLQFPMRLLLGPALYFYACATMSPEKKMSKHALGIALSGPVLLVLAMLPFLLGLSSGEKLALADPSTRNPDHWKIAVYTCVLAMLVFVLFTNSYLLAALKLHKRHYQQLMQRFSAIEQRSLNWFRIVLWIWGFVWLFYAVEYLLTFTGIRWFGSGVVFPVFEATILMVFTHLALKQPILKDTDKGEPVQNQARVATLKPEQMQRIAASLKQVMTEDALFKEEDLSLNRLSNAISVSENHISETLSQCLNSNFFQFVNGFRVEAAQSLLQSTDKLVSTIAFEVGFNTRSTFNTAFKKHTGMTPSAWRNQYKLNLAAKNRL